MPAKRCLVYVDFATCPHTLAVCNGWSRIHVVGHLPCSFGCSVMMSAWCHSFSHLPVESHTSCDVVFKIQFLTQSDTLRPFLVHYFVFETTFISPFGWKLHQLYKYFGKEMSNVNIYYVICADQSSVQDGVYALGKLHMRSTEIAHHPARSHKIPVFNRLLSTFSNSRRQSLLYRMDSRRQENTNNNKNMFLNAWKTDLRR